MILIAIGVFLFIMGCVCVRHDWIGISVCIFIASVVAILMGFFSTPVGYDYNLIYETRLAEGNASSTITIDKARESANYYIETENELCEYDEKAYVPAIRMENVTFIESDSIDVSVLQFYEITGKKSWWSFAFGFIKYEYVFRVPKGTVTLISTGNPIELE